MADRSQRGEDGDMPLNDALGRRSQWRDQSGGLDLAGPIGVNIYPGGRSGSGPIAAVVDFPKKIVLELALDLVLEDQG